MPIRFYKGVIGLLEIEGYQGAGQDAVFEEVWAASTRLWLVPFPSSLSF